MNSVKISENVLPILIKTDKLDGMIYTCPHCHRHVMADRGIKTCQKCGGKVGNDNRTQYAGPVKFDGEESWEK
jgi:hypothetical protein